MLGILQRVLCFLHIYIYIHRYALRPSVRPSVYLSLYICIYIYIYYAHMYAHNACAETARGKQTPKNGRSCVVAGAHEVCRLAVCWGPGISLG